MADQQLLEVLKKGHETWNSWRKEHPDAIIDLSNVHFDQNFVGYNLKGAIFRRSMFPEYVNFNCSDLSDANFSKVSLTGAQFLSTTIHNANFSEARLSGANFSNATSYSTVNFYKAFLPYSWFFEAYLPGANFNEAEIRDSDFSGATLTGATFVKANLSKTKLLAAKLDKADLSGANLIYSTLVDATIEKAKLTGCLVFGISAWELNGTPEDQSSLNIQRHYEVVFDREPFAPFKTELRHDPKGLPITVDDLQVAQFIYLLLNREKLRNVLDTITSKAVLILGRFTPERKEILEAIADELRKNNLLPIIFDFEGPIERDITKTIKILAGISLFVIVDITNPKSAPLELQATVPDYEIPFVPIIKDGEKPFSMFKDLGKYNWFLPLLKYKSIDSIRSKFKPAIIERAWHKRQELQKRKSEVFETLSFDDFSDNEVK